MQKKNPTQILGKRDVCTRYHARQEEAGRAALGSGGKTALFPPKFPAWRVRNEQGRSRARVPVPSLSLEGEQASAGATPRLDLRSLNDGNSSRLALRSAGA